MGGCRSSAPRLALRIPYRSPMSSSMLATRRCATELDRRYPAENGRGDTGISIAPAFVFLVSVVVSSLVASSDRESRLSLDGLSCLSSGSGWVYSMILLALSLDGIAGV